MIKLKIDEIGNNNFLKLWIIYIVIIFAFYFINENFIPDSFQYLNIKEEKVNNNLNLKNETYIFNLNKTLIWEGTVDNLERHNMFYLLKLNKVTNNSKNDTKLYNNLYEKYYNITKDTPYIISYNINIYNNDNNIIYDNKGTLKFKLSDNTIYFPYYFNTNSNKLKFKLALNIKEINNNFYVNHYYIMIESNNYKFIDFIIYLKISLLMISIIVFIYYNNSFKTFNIKSVQQEIIYKLGLMLILFNNPIYFINYHYSTLLTLIFGSFINNSLYCYISYLWLIVFADIEYQNIRKISRTLYKLYYKIFLYLQILFGTIRILLNSYMFLNDPINIISESYFKYYEFFNIIFIILTFIIYFFILKHLFSIIINFDNLFIRQKIFIICSIYFILTFGLCILTSFDYREYKHIL